MKFINVFMFATILFSNITGNVQARAESKDVSESIDQKIYPVIDDIYTFGEKSSSDLGLDVTTSESQLSNTDYLLQGNDCVQPPPGLVDWWTADGDWNDSVGGHHGTPFNGVTFAPGKVGQAFSFDGIDDYIGLGEWFTYQDFTITMWVKPGSTQNVYADIMDNNHTYGVNWVIQQNGGVTNQYSWGGPFNLSADQWQYLTVVHDSNGNYREYLNGSLSGTNNWGLINYTGSNSLFFGKWGGNAGRNWKGLLDEIDVYNRTLSETEIASLFMRGRRENAL